MAHPPAGIANPDIDLAELATGILRQLENLITFSYIARLQVSFATRPAYLFRYFPQQLAPPRCHCNPAAQPAQLAAEFSTDARRGSGYHDVLSSQLIHASIVEGPRTIQRYTAAMVNPGRHEKHTLIYEVVCEVPYGQVVTYGQVALLAGLPGHARLAGYAMFNLPEELADRVPWHRVINSQGRISYSESRRGNDHRQRELLEQEGVEFDSRGRIDLARFGWKPQ